MTRILYMHWRICVFRWCNNITIVLVTGLWEFSVVSGLPFSLKSVFLKLKQSLPHFSLSSVAFLNSSWSFLPVSLDFISLETICFKYCFLSCSSLGVVNSFSNKIALKVVISSIIFLFSIDRSFLKSFSAFTAAGFVANNLRIVLT